MKTLIILFLSYFIPQQDTVQEMLLGKWTYVRGSYEYYDEGGKKLKESDMDAIKHLDLDLAKDAATIRYSETRSKTSPYTITQDGGKNFLVANLTSGPFKYEILSITASELVLLAKYDSNFYLDGDVNKKASYCLVKIYLARPGKAPTKS